LTRTTTILSVLFFLSCLALAVFSIRQSKSLMRNIQSQEASNTTALPKPEPQKPTQESALPAKSPAQETPAQAPLNQETTKSAPQ
jgi:preprotein translocase subunit SecG